MLPASSMQAWDLVSCRVPGPGSASAVVSNPFVEEHIEPTLNRIGAPIVVYGFFLNNRDLGLKKKQTARKRLENFERDSLNTKLGANHSKGTREFSEQGASCSKGTKDFRRRI